MEDGVGSLAPGRPESPDAATQTSFMENGSITSYHSINSMNYHTLYKTLLDPPTPTNANIVLGESAGMFGGNGRMPPYILQPAPTPMGDGFRAMTPNGVIMASASAAAARAAGTGVPTPVGPPALPTVANVASAMVDRLPRGLPSRKGLRSTTSTRSRSSNTNSLTRLTASYEGLSRPLSMSTGALRHGSSTLGGVGQMASGGGGPEMTAGGADNSTSAMGSAGVVGSAVVGGAGPVVTVPTAGAAVPTTSIMASGTVANSTRCRTPPELAGRSAGRVVVGRGNNVMHVVVVSNEEQPRTKVCGQGIR